MGAAEQRVRSQKNAEDLKRRGVQRRTGMCPWGCGSTYATDVGGTGSKMSDLITHLGKCRGGGAKKRNRLTSVVSRMGRNTKRDR
jgi:hypothetical protein